MPGFSEEIAVTVLSTVQNYVAPVDVNRSYPRVHSSVDDVNIRELVKLDR